MAPPCNWLLQSEILALSLSSFFFSVCLSSKLPCLRDSICLQSITSSYFYCQCWAHHHLLHWSQKWIPNILPDSRLKPLQPILYNVTRLIFLKRNIDLPPISHTFKIFRGFPSATECNPISPQGLLGPDDLMTWPYLPSTASPRATFPMHSGPSTLALYPRVMFFLLSLQV